LSQGAANNSTTDVTPKETKVTQKETKKEEKVKRRGVGRPKKIILTCPQSHNLHSNILIHTINVFVEIRTFFNKKDKGQELRFLESVIPLTCVRIVI
jgi:hypothetical protein